jgi:hypothetical protein
MPATGSSRHRNDISIDPSTRCITRFSPCLHVMHEHRTDQSHWQGFEADHPNIKLLRLRNFTLGCRLKEDEILGPKFLRRTLEIIGALKPFVSNSSCHSPYLVRKGAGPKLHTTFTRPPSSSAPLQISPVMVWARASNLFDELDCCRGANEHSVYRVNQLHLAIRGRDDVFVRRTAG